MKTQRKIEVGEAAVVAMVRDVLKRDTAGQEGLATYLRTLAAAVQVELGGTPRMADRGHVRKVTVEDALAALTTVNNRFYAIVLAELNPRLDALTRNAQSGFARSSASSLRTAFREGLNPLAMVLPKLTKGWLRTWTAEHRPEATPVDATRRVKSLAKRLHALIEPLPAAEKTEALVSVQQELGIVAIVPRRATDVAPGAQVLPFDRRHSIAA